MNAPVPQDRKDIRAMLQSLVDKFIAAIGYPRHLTVSPPYYPYDDPEGTQQYPSSDSPGCYIYAAGSGQVQYVGKASRYLGNRIWAHIRRRRKPGEGGDLYPDADSWLSDNEPNIGVWCVELPDEHWWLAAALEGFMTEAFFPGKPRQV
jgi:hypothetical protein